MYEPAEFIKTFVTDIDVTLAKLKPDAKLTDLQRIWLGFCLMGILLTNSVCWAKFERASLGSYKIAALSWMFREAKIAWDYFLLASVTLILERHGMTEGVLVLDESDRTRSKRTQRIYGVHKQKHKSSGGYVNGQTVVLLLLITQSVTFPVGFAFYRPDPALSAWTKENKRLKYEDESDYRYLVATDMTWRTLDVVQAYTLRWLVEVFFEDWKLYEGWGRKAKQLDEEGSSRGLILSLLFDHCILLHPEQTARIENKLPAFTVGSLQRKSQMEALLEFIRKLLEDENPADKLNQLATLVDDVFQLIPSGKHMSGRDLGRLEPTASLKYRSAG